MRKLFKNDLDEMQEQTLLKIESRGFWLAFYGLTIAILIQVFIGNAPTLIAGESVLLLILSGYVCGACLRNGIWSRGLKANPQTNAIVSAVAGLIVGIFWAVRSYLNYQNPIGSAAVFVFCAGMTFAAAFAILSFASAVYKKKKQTLESEDEDSDKN